MKQINSFEELKVLKSDAKKYYLMQIKKQWYAIALEDFQVTFLQQHIPASRFNLCVDSNKLKEATKPVITYDFTNLDDDQLIHMFFERQKAYEETVYQQTPEHLKQKCADDRSIQDNEEYSSMSPYDFKKPKKDENTYYIMNIRNKWHAIALEYYQVKFLKNHITKNIFNYPVNSEKLQEATQDIKIYNFSSLEDDRLLEIFFKQK